MNATRRGVILPVVLLMLLLLGVLVATFSFRVHADLASTRAMEHRLQTRLAAEAGIEKVKLLLAVSRNNMDVWYHNPDELHRIILWSYDGDETVWGSNEELDEGTMAYRFSIVADDPTDDEDFCRYGITDESSKLNLNIATEAQLLTLVTAAVGDEQEEIKPQTIVNAILDWRDKDTDPRGEEGDTEREYYRTLVRPYRVKNGPFDTVEELLLVKGVSGQVFYGEDYDRNGLLTPNEDDGDETFPPDNQDGALNRGLYPFLTVLSYERNVSNDNRPRVYLPGTAAMVRAQLAEVFPDDPGIVDYIVAATRNSSGGGSGGGGDGGEAGGGRRERGGDGGERGGGGEGREGDGNTETGGRGSRRAPSRDNNTGSGVDVVDDKQGSRQQYRQEGSQDKQDPAQGGEGEEGGAPDGEQDGDETKTGGEGESDGAAGSGQPIRSPAELLGSRMVDGQQGSSPLTVEHLAVLMDRTTTIDPQQERVVGLININTAERLVLRCIDGLSEEQIESIIATRASVEEEAKRTTAWLITEEVVDLDTYIRIAPSITARGEQFTIESLGYADHIGMVARLQVVVDLIGPIAQTIYYRDLSNVGGHFPIREEDEEKIRVE